MRSFVTGLFAALIVIAPLEAQRPWWYWRSVSPPPQVAVANLNGFWYLTGNPQAVCEIRQRWPATAAEFINEHGSPRLEQSWRTVFGFHAGVITAADWKG